MIHHHVPHATASRGCPRCDTHGAAATSVKLDLSHQRIVELLQLHHEGLTGIDDCLRWSYLTSGLNLNWQIVSVII